MTRITFYGVAAYEIVTRHGQHILLDPFLDENPGSPVHRFPMPGRMLTGEMSPRRFR